VTKGRSERVTLDELQMALKDPECPYLVDGGDYVDALRGSRQLQRTRVLRLVDLADFLESLGTKASFLPELDRLMIDEVGAERIDVVNLGELHHRLLRRITRRRPPMTNIHYEVPDLPSPSPARPSRA
jgi:hypothetical protein